MGTLKYAISVFFTRNTSAALELNRGKPNTAGLYNRVEFHR